MEFRVKEKLNSPFARFVCRKLMFLLIGIFISMNLIFILPRLMPSNPVDIMLAKIIMGGTSPLGGTSPDITPGRQSAIEVLRRVYIEKFGINEPLTVQYVCFWRRIFTLDFGFSYYLYPKKVIDMVKAAMPWTLALVIPVLPIGFLLGNYIGTRSAFYRGKVDALFYYLSMIFSLAPYYWFSSILIFVFAVNLGWFPVWGGYSSKWLAPVLNFEWFLDAAHHYVLPFLSLVGMGIGGWAVSMRAMTIHEMGADYISYTYTLGFRKKKLRKYAERNAILPNFTWLPVTLAGLISGALVVEVIFGYPGLGTLMYHAIFDQDYPLIEATSMITILITLVGNFICDILYGRLDPRIGSGYVEGG